MMLVKTRIAPSAIHGLGLFADQFIEKGTVIWRFTPGIDARFTAEQLADLPPAAQEFLTFYAFSSKEPGLRVVCTDHGKYFNHSSTPTALSAHAEGEEEVVTRALRDILPGEEITDDYRSYEPGFVGFGASASSRAHVDAYLAEYYGALTEENLAIGRFLAGATRPRGGALRPLRALDMGCGPAMLYWAPFVDGYDEHHGVDAEEDSIAALRDEIAGGLAGRMHARYAPIYEQLDVRSAAAKAARFRALCQRVRSVELGDAGGTWAFDGESMDLVTMLFSLEVLAGAGQVRSALSEARRVLASGGRLVLCTLGETTRWRVGDHVGRCLHFTAPSLRADLVAAGFGEVSVERRAATTAVAREQGYAWMLFATATRT
jgi:SAM-dependent methyltransferase